jgi:acetylornithine deacetylase/succinyl-diaminopimelate desuccinylase-like protein
VVPKVLAYAERHRNANIERLFEFLRLPSVSAQIEHGEDMLRTAHWVSDAMADAGMDARVIETDGHPVVYGERRSPKAKAPTVLIYGHYDVQPPGVESLWTKPAFHPWIDSAGRVYARGAADDKGQLLAHVLALDAWHNAGEDLPVNVKFLIEGEEEVGSPNIAPFVEKHPQMLACDYVVISDTAKFSSDLPAVTYGTKGLIYREIIVSGPRQDLHSGHYGGTVANPVNVLAQLIAAMHDDKGRIAIPGFYDSVRPLSDEERAAWKALAFDEGHYLNETGSPQLTGERGFTTLERMWGRPTLDANGMVGGYHGEGASTIIPAVAAAKVSVRLVPDQQAEAIGQLFDDFVYEKCPSSVVLEIRSHAAADPYICPADCPGLHAAKAAVAKSFGREPVLIREGGSLPVLPTFKRVLGAESLLVGFCDPNSNAHGPNEFLHKKDFEAGIRMSIRLLDELDQAMNS